MLMVAFSWPVELCSTRCVSRDGRVACAPVARRSHMLRRASAKPFADEVAGAIDLLTRFCTLRLSEKMSGEFELHRDADKSLCQCVVNLACDAVALGEYCVELGTNGSNAEPVDGEDNGSEQQDCEAGEPERAIERRLDGEG